MIIKKDTDGDVHTDGVQLNPVAGGMRDAEFFI